MSYIDVTGKTEEEAIANALRQLGMDRDDVSVEVLERAKSGFLGIGACPAKIRVTYGIEEEPPVEPEEVHEVEEAPVAEPVVKAPKPRVQEQTEDLQQPAEEFDGETDEKAKAIRAFLTGLLEQLECPAEIHIDLPEKGRYKVNLEGQNMGAIIGRRGETLDAIQQLTSYSVNRSGGGRVRVHLDTEGYREKREKSLQNLARKVAGKVVKYRRSVTLEPMNAYERHVIHTALQDYENVTTHSVGTDPNRRVVISYER